MAVANNWTLNLSSANNKFPIQGASTEHKLHIALTGNPSFGITRGWRVESDNPNSPEAHPVLANIGCEKELDHTTLPLLYACCNGIMFKLVEFFGWTTVNDDAAKGKDKQVAVTIFRIYEAGLTSANYGGTQSLEFAYNEIQYEYHEYGPDGKEVTALKTDYDWSRQTNKARGA